MENFCLVKPDLSMVKEISAFKKEFLATNGERMNGCSHLEKFDKIEDWIKYVQDISSEVTLPKNSVLSDQYVYIRKSDNKIVGMIVFRKLNKGEYFDDFLGNLGYAVRPSERRKGIAKSMIKDILPECKKAGYKSLSLVCHKVNEASRRTIISCGGRLEKVIYYNIFGRYEEKYILDL